jgi:E3 ubiquitin-protein ligase listerin
VQQAVAALKASSCPVEDVFPSSNIWMTELSGFLQEAPRPSLALTSSLGGAYFLVKSTSGYSNQLPARDREHRSIPARMALYTSRLLSSGVELASLPEKFQEELLYLLYLTVELAADQLTLMQDGGLWASISDHLTTAEMEEFISSTRKTINSLAAAAKGWGDGNLEGDSLLERLIRLMLKRTSDLSPMALYSAKALSDLLQALVEAHGLPARCDEVLAKLGVLQAKPALVLAGVAFITGFGELIASSKAIGNFCNRLISDTVGLFASHDKALISMVLLNACAAVYGIGELPVENRRQVFALKQMTQWTDTPDEMVHGLASETCKGIHRILPNVTQVYGPYWEQTVKYCILLWTSASQDPLDSRLTYLHSSLKLMSALEAAEDPNDDLVDALATHAESKSKALLELLQLPYDSNTQPCQIVSSLLCRSVGKIPLEHLTDLSGLYGLVASDSRDIQTAAFGLLHRALPAAQEKLSVDVLLEKSGEKSHHLRVVMLLINCQMLDCLTSFYPC